jgi:murein L,D-transpeptidase YafK
MTISRRSLLLGGPALLGLSGCGTTSAKHRSNRPVHATAIVVRKAERRLELMQGDRVLKAFDIALGSDPVGPKRQEGDGKTPEGAYFVHRKKADSAYHLAVGISYPNTVDVARARAAGVPPGGNIFIHGQPSGITGRARIQGDWTAGCIAVSNSEIEEIYASVREGIPIFLRP